MSGHVDEVDRDEAGLDCLFGVGSDAPEVVAVAQRRDDGARHARALDQASDEPAADALTEAHVAAEAHERAAVLKQAKAGVRRHPPTAHVGDVAG